MSLTQATPAARLHHHRRSVVSRASSASLSDDEDAITPVGPADDSDDIVAPVTDAASTAPHQQPPSTPSSCRQSAMTAAVAAGERLDELARSHTQSPWRLGPADGEHLDPARLWKMMLAIQRRFRCYNSARMSAALEDAAVEAVVPSRACLDLLNDNIAKLPDDARKRVADFIASGGDGCAKQAKRRSGGSWRRGDRLRRLSSVQPYGLA